MVKKKPNKTQISVYRPILIEQFKAEVENKPVRFPKELGEEHPFNFKNAEDVYKKVGIAKAAVDKHIDFIVSPGFHVSSDDSKAETLINDFIRKTGFDILLRKWILEALVTGNGFMEIAIEKEDVQLKVINSESMFVKRNKKGVIKGYNQLIGKMERFNMKDVIPFTPPEIAHLPIDIIGDGAYGLGLIVPADVKIGQLLRADQDMHTLMKRKANSPIHAKLGSVEEPATSADVDNFGAKLEHLTNLHEWATDHRVEFNVIDFQNFADKFDSMLRYDSEILFEIFQVPAVIMGQANIPEGLANVQMDTFERRIQSLQAHIERIVEQKIFKPILEMNGLDSHVEMDWGQASETRINERITKLTELMKNPFTSATLKAAMEIDIANLLGYEDTAEILISPKKAQEEEIEREKEETELEQPEIPGEKEHSHNYLTENTDMRLTEWLNFDYEKYRDEVLKFIKNDKFAALFGDTPEDLALGKLTQEQIGKVRNSLEKGFTKNSTIREIEDDIAKIGLPDRFTVNAEGKRVLQLSAEFRPNSIARSESTRVAAEGVLKHYGKQEIERVRWLASISARTCPICEGQNGLIFNINEASGQIPAHTSCRCAWVSIEE